MMVSMKQVRTINLMIEVNKSCYNKLKYDYIVVGRNFHHSVTSDFLKRTNSEE